MYLRCLGRSPPDNDYSLPSTSIPSISGTSGKPHSVTPDHRFLSCASCAIRCTWGSTFSHCVVTGDSEGVCSLYGVEEPDANEFSLSGLYYLGSFECGGRPIISLEIIQIGAMYIAVCGLTDGRVMIWNVSESVADFASVVPPSRFVPEYHSSKVSLMYTVPLHKMGVNALSVCINREKEVVIATGGDDQAIGVIVIRTSGLNVTPPSLSLLSHKLFESVSGSTLKGINVMEDYIYVSGYEQRLDMWKIVS
jgi:hypothetical protein